MLVEKIKANAESPVGVKVLLQKNKVIELKRCL